MVDEYSFYIITDVVFTDLYSKCFPLQRIIYPYWVSSGTSLVNDPTIDLTLIKLVLY